MKMQLVNKYRIHRIHFSTSNLIQMLILITKLKSLEDILVMN